MSDVTRIINDTSETHQLARDLVKDAQSEILLLFSAENGFRRTLEAGNGQFLLEAATRGVIVTVLAPMNEFIKNEARSSKHRMGIYRLEVLNRTIRLTVVHLRLS